MLGLIPRRGYAVVIAHSLPCRVEILSRHWTKGGARRAARHTWHALRQAGRLLDADELDVWTRDRAAVASPTHPRFPR